MKLKYYILIIISSFLILFLFNKFEVRDGEKTSSSQTKANFSKEAQLISDLNEFKSNTSFFRSLKEIKKMTDQTSNLGFSNLIDQQLTKITSGKYSLKYYILKNDEKSPKPNFLIMFEIYSSDGNKQWESIKAYQ